MKRTVLTLLCLLLLLAGLCSCAAERYDLLYSEEADGLTFCVRGTGTRTKQVTVKRGEDLLFAEKIRADSDVGTLGGSYGLEIADLNFDGRSDFWIVTEVAGECRTCVCWLQTENGEFERSEALTGLCNLRADAELEAVFAFEHSYRYERAYEDQPESTETSDSTTKYIWSEGKLLPSIRATVTYYSFSGLYCYSVSYYDEELGELGASDDKWMTEEEYKMCDMGFLYYFR